MPKAEWGTKRLCPATGRRFYDLNKTPIVSPYTGEVVTLDGPKTRGPVVEKPVAKVAAREEETLDEDVILDDNAEADLDDELLEDDEDDTVSLDDIADVGDGDDEA